MSNTSPYFPFLSRHQEMVPDYLLRKYPFSMEQLKKWRNKLDWETIASNIHLPWSLELFREFDYELTMREDELSPESLEDLSTVKAKPGEYHLGIYFIEKIQWSIEFLDFAKDKLTWFLVTEKWPLEMTVEMLDRYADYFDFYFINGYWDLPWTSDLLERYADKWDYHSLSVRLKDGNRVDDDVLKTLERLSPEYFTGFTQNKLTEKDRIVFNNGLKMFYKINSILDGEGDLSSEEFFFLLDHCTLNRLIASDRLNWTSGLIDYLSDRKDWEDIFDRREIFVNEELIDKYIDRIPFGKREYREFPFRGLSSNVNMPWSVKLIEKYRDRWNWKQLSINPSIPACEELLEAFIDLWDWDIISCTWGRFWTHERLRHYKDRIDWKSLSTFGNPVFTPELLEEFENMWDYNELRSNKHFEDQVLKDYISNDLVEAYFNNLSVCKTR